MPRFFSDFNYIPVPKEFIEKHMPQANGAYVKVYLLAMSLGYEEVSMPTAEMARILNLLESDVVNALNYWKNQGALQFSEDSAITESVKNKKADEEAPKKKSMQEIAEEMTENKDLADLCALSQEILGKPLKNREIETIYWFYDELGLSPEVITLLLEYCVSKDKRSMSYIEKVAISWHENGIVTLDAADKFITAEKEKSGYFYSLRKLFGITDRNLTKTEETYLKTWRDKYGMNEDMVGLAYEYCVMQINKMSYPYMDTIIKRWAELGITTVEAAEQDHKDFKSKGKQTGFDVYDDKNVDYGEIEKLMREKM